jgi:hypothetical protein
MALTFEVLDHSVLPFLNELVQREQIRLKDTGKAAPLPVSSRAERFAGALKLSEQQYREFSDSVTQSKNEWDRDIF